MVPRDEAVFAAFGMTAIRGHVEGGDQLGLVGQHLAASRVDGIVRISALVGEPAVGLVRLTRAQVEVRATTQVRNPVSASGDRLRLEGLNAPVGRHFRRNDAL